MARMKYVPGAICSVDPENYHNQDVRGVHLVCLKNKVKRRLFGNTLWKVEVLDGDTAEGKTTYIQERYLYPDNMVIIRNPIMPPITSNDIELLNSLYKETKNKKVKALAGKLEFYKKLREV